MVRSKSIGIEYSAINWVQLMKLLPKGRLSAIDKGFSTLNQVMASEARERSYLRLP